MASLSHQAVASFAAKLKISFQDSAEKICSFFRRLGFDHVFDLTLARHLSLNETIREFLQHYTRNRSLPIKERAPLLTSVCPGFVCYVEKTHPQLVPLLSKVKSPQQIQGYLLRNVWCQRNGIAASQVYHVTLMPCFDKKLEASRKEFINGELKDVDCVITPVELEVMLQREAAQLSDLPNVPLEMFLKEYDQLQQSTSQILSHIGSGSGGYAEHVYRSAMSIAFDQDMPNERQLKYPFKRNKDFVDIENDSIEQGELNVAIVNGFRNIQTIVQRQKRKTLNYDYIEVMACPTGCLNGGGMLRGVSFDQIDSSYRECKPIEMKYNEAMNRHRELCENLFADQSNGGNSIESPLHTSFNVIPKMENVLHIAW